MGGGQTGRPRHQTFRPNPAPADMATMGCSIKTDVVQCSTTGVQCQMSLVCPACRPKSLQGAHVGKRGEGVHTHGP